VGLRNTAIWYKLTPAKRSRYLVTQTYDLTQPVSNLSCLPVAEPSGLLFDSVYMIWRAVDCFCIDRLGLHEQLASHERVASTRQVNGKDRVFASASIAGAVREGYRIRSVELE